MDAETYKFKVGDFRCMAVSDGAFTYAPPIFPPPAAFLFVNAPEGRRAGVLGEHGLLPDRWGAWVSTYTCLLVEMGDHRVLVDTGAGSLGPNTGRLLRNLRAEGVAPGDIDTVVFTHAHPDHLGGTTDQDGKLVFPKARYVMWKGEWEFWTSGQADRALAGHGMDIILAQAHKNLSPIRAQVDLVDTETEIMPGISAVAAPGHTPGHMALSISSKDDRLLCVSDTVLHPVHLAEPDWCAAVEIVSSAVPGTRRGLLKKAADEKALVLAFHFPFPGLGHVLPKGEAWRWESI